MRVPQTSSVKVFLRKAFLPEDGTKRFALWFGGLFPLSTCVAQPITTQWMLKKMKAPHPEAEVLSQEQTVRQLMGAAIIVATFVGGAILGAVGGEKNQTIRQIALTGLFNLLSYGFLRPALNTSALGKLRQWGNPKPHALEKPIGTNSAEVLTPSRMPLKFATGPNALHFLA